MGLDMYLYASRIVTDADACLAILDITGPLEQDYYVTADGGRGEPFGEPSVYLGRWAFMREDGRDEVAKADAVIELIGFEPLVGEESNSVTVTAAEGGLRVDMIGAYWRKANAIHSWFVEHCQDGIDECQESEVHCEQLAQLRFECESALDAFNEGDLSRARTIMEPQEGFFFGPTDIDEWWARDMENTVAEIERLITAAISIGGVDFIYRSSW